MGIFFFHLYQKNSHCSWGQSRVFVISSRMPYPLSHHSRYFTYFFFNIKILNNQYWHMLSNRFYTLNGKPHNWVIRAVWALVFANLCATVRTIRNFWHSTTAEKLLLRTEIWKPSGFLESAESQLKPPNQFATNPQEGHQFRCRQKRARQARCCQSNTACRFEPLDLAVVTDYYNY